MMLVESGLPFDVALGLEDHERIGLIVMLGEIKGGTFDWDRMNWKDDDSP
jgi:hypothetical protein